MRFDLIKRGKCICASLLVAFLLLACAVNEGEPNNETRTSGQIESLESENTEVGITEPEVVVVETTEETTEETIEYKGMTVTTLDVGQGLSVLINADDHLLLYDGGGRERSSYVVSYLEQHGYADFDYMVASHYDEDHIAGLVGCLHNYSYRQVLCPDYEASTEIFRSFLKALELNGAEIVHPRPGDEFKLGSAVVSVLGPTECGSAKDNNNSIVIRVVYGDFSCIITGDAEVEEEEAILASGAELKSDLYIVGHHGSANSSSENFVNAIAPKAAVISCGEYNDYGHPTLETLAVLEKLEADIYRTDKQGEISCKFDAEKFDFSLMPCDDHSPGAEPISVNGQSDGITNGASVDHEETGKDSNITTYILNTNTRRFHYPDCRSVKTMKEKNKQEVEATREEVIQRGYDPCGNCNP